MHRGPLYITKRENDLITYIARRKRPMSYYKRSARRHASMSEAYMRIFVIVAILGIIYNLFGYLFTVNHVFFLALGLYIGAQIECWLNIRVLKLVRRVTSAMFISKRKIVVDTN